MWGGGEGGEKELSGHFFGVELPKKSTKGGRRMLGLGEGKRKIAHLSAKRESSELLYLLKEQKRRKKKKDQKNLY